MTLIFDPLIELFDRKGSKTIHCFATSWNWDNGVEMLDNCVQHPLCDRATAQDLFIKAESAYHLLQIANGKVYEKMPIIDGKIKQFDDIGFLQRLVGKWNEDRFVSGIASSTDRNLSRQREEYRDIESRIQNDRLPWVLRDDMFEEIQGIKVHCGDADFEGFNVFF